MSYAALNAQRVYKACRAALAECKKTNVGNENSVRLQHVTDLALVIMTEEQGNIFITAEDFALFGHCWTLR